MTSSASYTSVGCRLRGAQTIDEMVMPDELTNRLKAIVNRKAEQDRVAALALEAKHELERENTTKREAASALDCRY
jgi:hypothetical protein